MLSYNFTRIFKLRGIKNPYTYLVRAGFSEHFAVKIANDKVRQLRLHEFEKLCLLLSCTPNHIMEWKPDSLQKVSEKHPMRELIRIEREIDIVKTLNSVPFDKIREIEELIKNRIKDE